MSLAAKKTPDYFGDICLTESDFGKYSKTKCWAELKLRLYFKYIAKLYCKSELKILQMLYSQVIFKIMLKADSSFQVDITT